MTQLHEDLQWRGPVETCSRSGIKAMGDGGQRALGVAGQVGAFVRILAQQAIGVLVGAAPVARHRVGRDLSGVVGNGRHVGEVAPSIRPPAHEADAPEAAWPRVHCAGRREVCPTVVRILAAEASGNLCGREAPGQTCPDIAHHPRIQEFHSPEADAPELLPGSAPCWYDRGPLIALLACSRLTVLGAGPNTVAIVRNAWHWASPRLRVSRSSTLTCV
jgi:hypothetical protein